MRVTAEAPDWCLHGRVWDAAACRELKMVFSADDETGVVEWYARWPARDLVSENMAPVRIFPDRYLIIVRARPDERLDDLALAEADAKLENAIRRLERIERIERGVGVTGAPRRRPGFSRL